MTCVELEELMADYLDLALGADQKATVEAHLAECPECSELARDASGAIAFMERAAPVDLPPVLMSKILAELNAGQSRAVVKASWIERLLGPRAGTILQPRFAMGLAMTILSLAMLGRAAGTSDPARIWTMAGNRMIRTWDRAVKGYENLALAGGMESPLDVWGQNAPEGSENR
jgi:anti-sigma factor RsiW